MPTATAVLGTGLLALDLIERIQNSPSLQCTLVVGRKPDSRGLAQAAELGCVTATGGIDALLDVAADPFDIVFDATSAFDHPEHAKRLADTGAVLVDLTPTSTGALIVPTVNGHQAAAHRHIGLVSCGGQASIPILHALAQRYRPTYVEMVATARRAPRGRTPRCRRSAGRWSTARCTRQRAGRLLPPGRSQPTQRRRDARHRALQLDDVDLGNRRLTIAGRTRPTRQPGTAPRPRRRPRWRT
ncbi:hypothetical protein [Streptomyces sp. RKCA744]|uniref:hypothetical protein n=1 Tax=Streptomyces sp. RKCA744 TaxID=2959340 RepID=UPI00209D7E5B|nr:hypothetical protein [Streptomyces sp. RKCA744]MCO8308820.1 hypothetical protein [Streptomyces sp. RKCA744]